LARVLVTYSKPVPGWRDLDCSEPFLERGTTFSFYGAVPELGIEEVKCDDIPVEHAYIKDEVLYVEGYANFG
jgi:hypothetical protein